MKSGARPWAKCLTFALLLCLPGLVSAAGDKQAEPAVIAGTVFKEPGFALPGAEVLLSVKSAPQGAKVPKLQKMRSDGRGEFAFRVPGVKAQYLVTVKAAGCVSQEKAVEISGSSERVDVYVELKAESK
jgi:hypothetical protein